LGVQAIVRGLTVFRFCAFPVTGWTRIAAIKRVMVRILNRALSRAVFHKRLDFIELLVTHGAQIEAIPFVDVLLVGSKK